jgi:hypothetical protein
MKIVFEKNSRSFLQLSLLIILVIALLTGRILIYFNTRVHLSEPIELKIVGVEASLPTGGSWRGNDRWNHDMKANAMVLTGHLMAGKNMAGMVQCRYVLSGQRLTEKERLKSDAEINEFEYVDEGVLQLGDVNLEWVQRADKSGVGDSFFGVAMLDGGRQIEIEAIIINETDYAKRVFMAVLSWGFERGNSTIDFYVDDLGELVNDAIHSVFCKPNGQATEDPDPSPYLPENWQDGMGIMVKFLNSGQGILADVNDTDALTEAMARYSWGWCDGDTM